MYDKFAKWLYKAFNILSYIVVVLLALVIVVFCPIALMIEQLHFSLVKAIIIYLISICAIVLLDFIKHVLDHGEKLVEKEKGERKQEE